jgi:hypothetical protein
MAWTDYLSIRIMEQEREPVKATPTNRDPLINITWKSNMWRDTGCELHPACLSCPELVCKEDVVKLPKPKAEKPKLPPTPRVKVPHVPKHGTYTEYTYWKCRCFDCRDVRMAYNRDLRRRNREKLNAFA